MNPQRNTRAKPLMYWSVISRLVLALVLSMLIWTLVIGVTQTA